MAHNTHKSGLTQWMRELTVLVALRLGIVLMAMSVLAPESICAPQKKSIPATPVKKTEKQKKTIIKINSNVPAARVSLDGIAYGNSGQEIEVQPGSVTVEVSAPGYQTKAIKTQIAPFTTSSFTVNLTKIAPKPQPVKPIAATSRRTSKDTATVPSQNKNSAKRVPSIELFDADTELKTSPANPVLPLPSTPSAVVVPSAPSQPVMPPQGYGFTPAVPQYSQSPYGNQMPAQPYGYPPAPVVPPYQMYPQYPAYPTYPTYAPYPYAPATPYGLPPVTQPPTYGYGFQTPPPSMPPSYTPPSADPYGGYLGPPPEAPSSSGIAPPPVADRNINMRTTPKDRGMPPPPILPDVGHPSSSAKKSRKSSSSSQCNPLVKLLPFGAGQFCRGATGTGLLLLGGQAASLYFYKANADAASSYQAKLNKGLAARDAARADTPAEDLDAFDSETASIKTQGESVIKQAQQNAQYSMISFAGLWTAGVIESMVNGSPKKSKKSKPKLIYSHILDDDLAPVGTLALQFSSSPIRGILPDQQSDIFVGYTPIKGYTSSGLIHAASLGLSMEL